MPFLGFFHFFLRLVVRLLFLSFWCRFWHFLFIFGLFLLISTFLASLLFTFFVIFLIGELDYLLFDFDLHSWCLFCVDQVSEVNLIIRFRLFFLLWFRLWLWLCLLSIFFALSFAFNRLFDDLFFRLYFLLFLAFTLAFDWLFNNFFFRLYLLILLALSFTLLRFFRLLFSLFFALAFCFHRFFGLLLI